MNIKTLLWESKLIIALVVMILARCVDRVLYTRITYDYNQFLWYFSNIICPLAFLCSSWPVVWYKLLFTDDITKEMKQFPHYKFAVMALFDALYNLLSAFPTPHIGGNLSNVLTQVNLPFNMLLSLLFLHTTYKRSHIMGAILVLYGGLVNMIPIFTGQSPGNMPDATAGWIILFIISQIPAAASNVYKEIGLKDVNLDIWYANAWVSAYQLLWGILTMWTIRIKAFCDPPVEWSGFFKYIGDAHNCFLGNPVNFNGQVETCDNGVFTIFLFYIFFNIIYNQLMLYVFREGSSVLFVVSSAVCLPLTDMLYMIPFLTGPQANQKFTIYDGFALFVLVMGLLVYHSEKEKRTSPSGNRSVEKSPMFTSPSLQKTHLMRKQKGRVVYRQSPMFPGKSPTSSQKRPLLSERQHYGTQNSTTNTARNSSKTNDLSGDIV